MSDELNIIAFYLLSNVEITAKIQYALAPTELNVQKGSIKIHKTYHEVVVSSPLLNSIS